MMPGTLSGLVDNDESLYRAVQGLIALAGAPGRRDVLLRRTHDRWEVVGLRGRTLEHPPAPLAITTDMKHRPYISQARHAPLAVESVAWIPRSGLSDVYLVDVSGVLLLRGPLDRLASALDARQEARQAAWWARRSREDGAGHEVALAIAALWEAAALVPVTSMH